MLNTVKSNFSFNEINKKKLTCDIFHRVSVCACRFTVFLALLHNHCYVSLRKHPFLLALRPWGRFARRNVCDSATEIPY